MSSDNLASWQSGHKNSFAIEALLIQNKWKEIHYWGQNWREYIWNIFPENKDKVQISQILQENSFIYII